MDKKHISIIGSCLSRHMFNCSPLADIFDVDKYAYQVCPWDIFSEGIDVKPDHIQSYYSEKFTARMLWYDLNKVTASEIENTNSEYLMIDLYIAVAAPIKRIEYKGKTVYSQCSYDRFAPFMKFISGKEEYSTLKVTDIQTYDFDQTIIFKGYDRLIEWATKRFDNGKIIINIPSLSKKYFDLDNRIVEYDESLILKGMKLQETIKKHSMYLYERIPGAILLDLSDNQTIAQCGIYDNPSEPIPTTWHYTDEDYCNQANKLKGLLGVSKYEHSSALTPLGEMAMKNRNMYLKEKLSKHNAGCVALNFLSINDYFERIEKLEDIIVVIVAKDEASNKLKNFVSRELLGIKANIFWRNSYIAIIDKKRCFKYEQASANMLKYEYTVEEKTLSVVSAGFDAGNFSSVKVNNSSHEYSQNKRGLNIVLLNAETLEVVDMANCDTFGDDELKVSSIYFGNVKIKV